MNLLLRIFAVGSLLTAAQTFAAEAFEGKVSFSNTYEGGTPQVMDYAIKGPKMRMDMAVDDSANGTDENKPKKSHKLLPSFLTRKSASDDSDQSSSTADNGKKSKKQGSTIMDMEKMEMLMLMPDQKKYMVMSMKSAMGKAAEHADKNQDFQHADKNQDIQRTGKTETILGYRCEQIIVTDKDQGTVTELWLAPNLAMFGGGGGMFAGGGGGGGGGGMFGGGGGGGGMFGGHQSATSAKWAEVLKGKPGFPLRVVTTNTKGKEISRMEVTKIEPGSLPDSLFLPPPDYQKFEMPDMGSMFRQG